MRRTILSALALVITLAFAAESQAASLGNTAWTGSAPLEGKTIPAGMVFKADGGFVFVIDVDGRIGEVQGTYSIEGSTLRVYVKGKTMTFIVISQSEDSLVLSDNGVLTTWQRLRK